MADEDVKEISLQELAIGERKFLHDLSNKLLVAQGMSKTVLKKLETSMTVTDNEINRLKKAVKASEDMIDLLHARRFTLHEVTKKNESNLES